MSYAIPITHKTKRRRIGQAKTKYFARIAAKKRQQMEEVERQVEQALAQAGLYTARPTEVTFQ